MVFSCIPFLYFFLPATLLLYFISPRKLKNFTLLVTSLVFYAWGEPKYVFVLLLSSAIDYCAGLLLVRFDEFSRRRTMILIFSVCMNLGLLVAFKYSGMFFGGISELLGIPIKPPTMPLGISFFTFQTMSYTIDLYRRKIKVQRNPVNFLCYVSMFPQIVAGPIVRYEDVEKELSSRSTTVSGVGDGVAIFIKGLSKKVLLANNIGMLWTEIKAGDYGELSVVGAWLGIIAFSMQIYFDFSGYSDMAVGLGKMLGFSFPQNFDHPYTSKSISEFWRRWHITLGTWFRMYVYIPLGGNRKGKLRCVANLLIVWALTGLWHGASVTFLLWGVYFGVLIIIERFFSAPLLEKLPSFVRMAGTYLLVLIGWVFFECDRFSDAFAYLGAMFGSNGVFADSGVLYSLRSYGVVLAVCFVFSTPFFSKLLGAMNSRKRLHGTALVLAPVLQVAMLLLCTSYLVNNSYNPFLYFRF